MTVIKIKQGSNRKRMVRAHSGTRTVDVWGATALPVMNSWSLRAAMRPHLAVGAAFIKVVSAD